MGKTAKAKCSRCSGQGYLNHVITHKGNVYHQRVKCMDCGGTGFKK